MSQGKQKVLYSQFVVVMNILTKKLLAVEPTTKEENNRRIDQPIRHARLLFWKNAY